MPAVDHVLGGYVASRARREGTPSKSGDAAVESSDAAFVGLPDVADGLSVRVVEVAGKLLRRDAMSEEEIEELPDIGRDANSDCVAEADFVAAHAQ
ncbi:hypothetical protein SLS56_009146 [Neofusicoccum ribis]|uniref:Uncharacterized protein n=1 Tax=Neofusicoccum ribis TaxID=45134 RepID=A0ABR3SI38_9PEZI